MSRSWYQSRYRGRIDRPTDRQSPRGRLKSSCVHQFVQRESSAVLLMFGEPFLKQKQYVGGGRTGIRNDSPIGGDALGDDSADENKWDSGRIINKSGRLHHCALSIISLPRPDRSSPNPSAVWPQYVTARKQPAEAKTHMTCTSARR